VRVRVIESCDSYGARCLKVQKRRLWWWHTVREFPPVGELAAMRMAEQIMNPRVLFDSDQEAGK